MLDFGDNPIPLVSGQHVLDIRSGKLLIEAWDETRSLTRRILSITRKGTGALDCSVQRFGGATGALSFLDLHRPQTAARSSRGSRQSFAEQFRRMLLRQFPQWEIAALSSAMDLRRSFSASFSRAHLHRANQHVAALACPRIEDEPELMCAALLWYDYLRSRLERDQSLSLCLFLPENAGNLTAHRLHWLTGRELRSRLFRFNEHGMAGEVDPQDLGNLETRLAAQVDQWPLRPELKPVLANLSLQRGVGCCYEASGVVSIRFEGLEFARIERDTLLLGIESKEKLDLSQIDRVQQFISHLSNLPRSAAGAEGALPSFPERWFESAVRNHLQALDPELAPEPLHGQVLTFAGGERNLIDLLAISHSGRLAIIELKTSEDIQLPMQGLDYWMRIRWHAERNELQSLFPTIPVANLLPKLLLVAPALAFHPANEIVLRYFSPGIEVERIGVNSDWEFALRVAFRLRGADLPISHQR